MSKLLDRLVIALISAIIIMIPLAIYAAIQEQKAWAVFAETHDCKVIGRMKGDVGVGYGVMANGKGGTGMVVTHTPDKTGYLCNDGVTYWR